MANVVRLILAGLRRAAPEALPPDTTVESLGGDDTGVPLEPYRQLLADVQARAGGVAILRAGRALEELVDPILFVLLNSDAVGIMIEKEARLARFIHSRHLVRILAEDANSVHLEHFSSVDDPPRVTENIASAGQHIALFEQLGCHGLCLRLPRSEHPERYVYEDGVYREPGDHGCNEWLFSWQRFEPTRRPMPGLDELLLSGETRPPLDEVTETVAAVERIVRTDMGRTWTVADVAARLDTSPRSLQRALSAESTRFSEVVDALRVSEARRLLETTELSVTEIGYVCGFADTSHFSRRFKARVGASPSAHRAATGDTTC